MSSRWPRKAEGARRGLIDDLEDKIVDGLLFFRWRSWVIVAGRRDSFAKKHDPIFEGVKQMSETANIISSNTHLTGMDAWIGQFLLERTCNRWA